MRQRTWSQAAALLIVLLSLASSPELNAQPLSIRGSIGVAHLPLPAWSDFWGDVEANSHYQQNNPNVYYALSVHYALSEHHSINLGTEFIRTTASLSSPMDNTLGVADWHIQGIPLTLGYEYRVSAFNEHFIPVAGAGVSYFFSQVDASFDQLGETDNANHVSDTRTGKGYGVHGSLGLISEMTQALSIVTQVRYRYSNGMAFTDSEGDVKVEFTGVDVSVGVAWTL